MPPKQTPFSKKTSARYAVVNRPQHDPLIHNTTASPHVFAQISIPSTSEDSKKHNAKIKDRGDLEEEFGLSGGANIRDNEGEAAEHGVYFDDTEYDYMQHMKDIGEGGEGGEVAWIEAPERQGKRKGKGKQRLEEALLDVEIDDESQGRELAPADNTRHEGMKSYQDQQDIPDAIAGFRPDMDPRLREVLEALEDEAYVDNEEDVFKELAGGGKAEEVDENEWEATGLDDDEAGWESDDTTKPRHKDCYVEAVTNSLSETQINDRQQSGSGDRETPSSDGDWFAHITKSASATLNNTLPASQFQGGQADTASVAPSAASALNSTRKKKRKGALTSSTGFSMTSSALARTESLSTLDSRFEKVAASYMDEIDEEDGGELDDTASVATGVTGRSSRWGEASAVSGGGVRLDACTGDRDEAEAPNLTSAGVDSVMDEFLSGPGGGKGRKMKKGGKPGIWGAQGGMDQLDEIRAGLGPARFKSGVKV